MGCEERARTRGWQTLGRGINRAVERLQGGTSGSIVVVLLLTAALGTSASACSSRPAPAAPAVDSRAAALAASTAQRTGNTDAIIRIYQARIRKSPNDAESYAVLGAEYYQKARDTGDPSWYGKAQAVFDAGLAKDPANVDALVGAGTLANARHQFREGLRIAERARSLDSKGARIYGVIADAQTELGMYAAAVRTLQTMVDLRPDLGSLSRISYQRELHGDRAGAIQVMQAAVTAGGPVAENTAWVRTQLGNLYFGQGDLAAAEHAYRETLAGLPQYVYALAGMAKVRAAQGRTAEAIALYRQAIARMPLPEFVIGLGELYETTGHPAEAKQQYDLVRAMQQLNLRAGVDVDMELALFDADHGGDATATVSRARAALARRPSVYAADALAWALYNDKRYAEARPFAASALRLGTRDASLLYHAGMIAFGCGDAASARRYLSDALALNPHFSVRAAPIAKRTLAGIEKRGR